jgi:hypothetical protein
MDSVQPTNWKHYLPSKYIVGLLVVVIAIIGMVAWRSLPHKKAPVPEQVTPVVTATGNPVDRDTDRDGVLDWQEIATGTDPYKPETTEGTPDALAFSNFKNSLDSDKATVFDQIKDTDKVSYTIFNSLQKRTAASETIDDAAFQGVVWDEFANYFKGLAPTDQYTNASFSVVASTSENDAAFRKALEKNGQVKLITEQNQSAIFTYLKDGSGKKQVFALLDDIDAKIKTAALLQIPSGLAAIHLKTLNDLAAISKLLRGYDPENTDSLYRYAHQVLIQMYEWDIVQQNIAFLDYYKDPQAAKLRAAAGLSLQ